MRDYFYIILILNAVANLLAEPRDLSDFTVGVNEHHLFLKDFPLLDDLDIQSERLDFFWNTISDPEGRVITTNTAYQSLLTAPSFVKEPLPVLCYGHPAYDGGRRPVSSAARNAFVEYALTTIEKLRTRTHLFEVWNEWYEMGGPGQGKWLDYLNLLKEIYSTIKAKYPDVILLGDQVAGDPGALKAGSLHFMDGLVIHPYFYGASGKARLPESALPAKVNRYRSSFQENAGSGDFPLYVTELGWPTLSAKNGVSPAEQAKFMMRSILLLAINPVVKGVWLYELRDEGTDPNNSEQHFGLVLPDGSPKPSYYGLKDLMSILRTAKSIERINTGEDEFLVELKVAFLTGKDGWILWTINPGSSAKLYLSGEDENQLKGGILGSFDNFRPQKEGKHHGNLNQNFVITDTPVFVCGLNKSPSLELISK